MPAKRVSMHKTKEVIRLKSAGLTLRVIASAVKLSLGAVSNYAKAAEQAGLSWPLPEGISDEVLRALLYGHSTESVATGKYAAPDCAIIHPTFLC